MSHQLFVRPDRQDTRVVEDLLAPGGGQRFGAGTPAIGRLVIDAPLAAERPALAEAATNAGVPTLIDPMTFGLQSLPSPSSPFARLAYATLASQGAAELDLARVVELVTLHQLSSGATSLIPPYFHLNDLEDGWAEVSVSSLFATAEYCEANGIELSAVAVLSGNRRMLSSEAGLNFVDRFVAAARDVAVQLIAVCVSPAGKPTDSYDGIARLVTILDRARADDAPAVAWRQGACGMLLSALGASGYETGIGQFESTDIRGAQRRIQRHMPLEEDEEFRRPRRPVYVPAIGRSIPIGAAEVLLREPAIQGELFCEIPGCCPTTEDTLERQRHHAVRARAYQLAELADQPPAWRLRRLLGNLETAIGSARRANEVLEQNDVRYRLPVANLTAQADYLRYRIEALGTARSA